MFEKLQLSQNMQDILTALNALPSSVNTFDKEKNRLLVKNTQLIINKDAELLNQLSNAELAEINSELSSKNYRLIKSQTGGWDLIDRYKAYENNYSEMFKVFTESSNDKTCGINALNQFMQQLLDHLKDLPDFSGEKQIELLDLGCGDGQVGASLMNVLSQKAKSRYTAVDRDSKFSESVKQNCEKYGINYIFHGQDFRTMQETLRSDKGSFVLASHLYTSTPMKQFIPLSFDMIGSNGILILIHNMDPESDPGQIKTKHRDFLNSITQDHPRLISKTFNELNMQATISLEYESDIVFPKLSETDWDTLKNIKQAAYDTDYSSFSKELLKAKRLIEFAISDRLEAFTETERTTVLNTIRMVLEQKNNTFKNKCAIQVALSPSASLELKKQFLEFKLIIENNPTANDRPGLNISANSSAFFQQAATTGTVNKTNTDQKALGFQ